VCKYHKNIREKEHRFNLHDDLQKQNNELIKTNERLNDRICSLFYENISNVKIPKSEIIKVKNKCVMEITCTNDKLYTIMQSSEYHRLLDVETLFDDIVNKNSRNVFITANGKYYENRELKNKKTIDRLSNKISKKQQEIIELKDKIKTVNNVNNSLNDEITSLKEKLLKYEQAKKGKNILTDYAILDEFINRTVFRRTRQKRNFIAGIKNNFRDFKKIPNINNDIQRKLKTNIDELETIFNTIKTKRIIEAHPEVNLTGKKLIKRVKNIIKTSRQSSR